MKTFYHCLIMWIPFILLFSCATYGVELLEGNKIKTTEYMGIIDVGPFFFLFIGASIGTVLYPLSFLPLTFVVSKYIDKVKFKMLIFTFFGGLIGGLLFNLIYDSRFVEEYNLSILSPIIIFGVIGFLFSLAEISIKKNIKFV